MKKICLLLLLVLTLAACAKPMSGGQDAYIIDCDPGSGDSVALMLAKANLGDSVKLLVSSYGSSPVAATTGNLSQLAQLYGFTAELLQGADKPAENTLPADNNEGTNGIAEAALPQSSREIIRENAADTIYQTIKKNKKVHYIVLGPMTNLASVLTNYPDAKEYIDRISAVGGGIEVFDISGKAEYNMYRDPVSAKTVFDSGLPITLLPLDATNPLELTHGEKLTLVTEHGDTADMVRSLITCNETNSINQGLKGAVIREAALLAYLNNPQIGQSESTGIDVITYGDDYGKTVKNTEKSNVSVITAVDKNGFIDEIKKASAKLYGAQ